MNYLETIVIRDLRLKIKGDLGMFLFSCYVSICSLCHPLHIPHESTDLISWLRKGSAEDTRRDVPLHKSTSDSRLQAESRVMN